MQNNKNNKEQTSVPLPIKFVHNFLQGVSHVDKKNTKNHVNFLKEALIDLLDHDAFESTDFRERFTAAITHFEIQLSYYEGFGKDEINQGVKWAIDKIEREVKHA
jgi:hypothetical protein